MATGFKSLRPAMRIEYDSEDETAKMIAPEAINDAHSTGKPKQRRFSNT